MAQADSPLPFTDQFTDRMKRDVAALDPNAASSWYGRLEQRTTLIENNVEEMRKKIFSLYDRQEIIIHLQHRVIRILRDLLSGKGMPSPTITTAPYGNGK